MKFVLMQTHMSLLSSSARCKWSTVNKPSQNGIMMSDCACSCPSKSSFCLADLHITWTVPHDDRCSARLNDIGNYASLTAVYLIMAVRLMAYEWLRFPSSEELWDEWGWVETLTETMTIYWGHSLSVVMVYYSPYLSRCHKGWSLLRGLDCHGDLCCGSNLLWRRLGSECQIQNGHTQCRSSLGLMFPGMYSVCW